MGEAEQRLTEAESIVSLAPSWAPGHLRMGEAPARLKQPVTPIERRLERNL